jgi:hypothetical protein
MREFLSLHPAERRPGCSHSERKRGRVERGFSA